VNKFHGLDGVEPPTAKERLLAFRNAGDLIPVGQVPGLVEWASHRILGRSSQRGRRESDKRDEQYLRRIQGILHLILFDLNPTKT
jgi:hypothetical protein